MSQPSYDFSGCKRTVRQKPEPIQIERYVALCREHAPKLPYHNYGHARLTSHYVKVLLQPIYSRLHLRDYGIAHYAALGHDLIYRLGEVDRVNVEESAQKAVILYYQAHQPYPVDDSEHRFAAQIARAIIDGTCHFEPPPDNPSLAAQLVHDADLAGFGQTWEKFVAIGELIRKEQKAPWAGWSDRVLAVTDQLLMQRNGEMYYTDYARKHWLPKAREYRFRVAQDGWPVIAANNRNDFGPTFGMGAMA